MGSEGSESSGQSLKSDLKGMIVEALMLSMAPADLQDDQPLFGPGGLGLDSVDALQLVVALDKNYGIKITDAETARGILINVNSMENAVLRHQAAKSNPI